MAKGHAYASWFFSQQPAGITDLGKAVWLLMALARRADWETGVCPFCQQELAADMGISRFAVGRLQDRLESTGWLQKVRRTEEGFVAHLGGWEAYRKWLRTRSSAAAASPADPSPPPEGGAGPPRDERKPHMADVPSSGMCENRSKVERKSHMPCAENAPTLDHGHDHGDHEAIAAAAGASEPLVFALWRRHLAKPLTDAVQEELMQLAAAYPPDRLAYAFAETTRCGGQSLGYVKGVLGGKRREPAAPRAKGKGRKGQPAATMAEKLARVDEVVAKIERGESYFGR